MYSLQLKTFTDVRENLASLLVSAPRVKTERWQGKDVSKDPAAATYELRNVVFEVPLHGSEVLDHWRQDIQPNLPWADDHFAERVGGEPLNPGVQWANWPWATSADRFRTGEELGPILSPQEWAYLAGIVDGDGTIYFKKHTPAFQGTLRVYQKDRAVLDHIFSVFKVGAVDDVSGDRLQELNGKTYENGLHQWGVGAILELRWLLNGLMPYLRVKKQAATSMLFAIEASIKNKNGGAPLKKVWGQDWPKRFNHSYMSRLWPKTLDGGGSAWRGHNHTYGDLQDLVEMLAKEPFTRQAWIPLFFPEDTGVGDGGRKPCTLGYQFLVRQGELGRPPQLHIWYPLRSCDFVRHWADDCYLAVRLLLWVLDRCRELDHDGFWTYVEPGTYSMHCTSLHIFENDRRQLLGTPPV